MTTQEAPPGRRQCPLRLTRVKRGHWRTADGEWEIRLLPRGKREWPWSVYRRGEDEPTWTRGYRQGANPGLPTLHEARYGLWKHLESNEGAGR